jgi:hypothetical protein
MEGDYDFDEPKLLYAERLRKRVLEGPQQPAETMTYATSRCCETIIYWVS